MFVLIALLATGCSTAYADEPLEECACPGGVEVVVEDVPCVGGESVEVALPDGAVLTSLMTCEFGRCRMDSTSFIQDGLIQVTDCDVDFTRITYLVP